jgi:hypothetical protein
VDVDVDAVDAVDAIDCCFSEMGSAGATVDATAGATVDATAGATVDACPPPTRHFVFGFVVFKVNMSSSLGVAVAAALTVCIEGGLEFALTIEAQDFIECTGTL